MGEKSLQGAWSLPGERCFADSGRYEGMEGEVWEGDKRGEERRWKDGGGKHVVEVIAGERI